MGYSGIWKVRVEPGIEIENYQSTFQEEDVLGTSYRAKVLTISRIVRIGGLESEKTEILIQFRVFH